MKMRCPLKAALGALTTIVSAAPAQSYLGANFTASVRTESNFIPPDTMGAVGIDHYVELINGRYSVFRKSDGVRVQTSTLNTFWSNAGAAATNFAFDPRVLYDDSVDRWFACSVDNGGAANSFLLAVSNSADPTAGWSGFKIDSDSDDTNWADFPMMGLNGNSVVLSANLFGIGSNPFRTGFVVVPKSDLLLPTPTVANRTSFENISNTGSSPQLAIDLDHSTNLLPILSSGVNAGFIIRSNIGISGSATLQGGAASYSVTAFPSAPTADQPGAKANIDVGDTRFQSVSVLNDGQIWAAVSVSVNGRAAIRWYRLNASSNAVLAQGTIADPELHLMRPSIAVNDLGDVVIGFSATSPNEFPSTYYVAGKTAAGTVNFGSIVKTYTGVSDYQRLDSVGRNRWGDYSATSVDPADPSIFWTIQEFVVATNEWADRVTEIIIPQPGEVRWKDPAGGAFESATNWLDGAAPSAGSHVIFSRATDPSGPGYTTTLAAGASINRLSVRQGRVTLAMNGNTIAAGNVAVAEFAGAPTLTIQNGTLDVSGSLSVGSRGRLVLQAGGNSIVRTASLANSGVIDLNDNDLVVDYSGPSPLSSIIAMIQSGALTSTSASTSPNAGEAGTTALGYGEAAALGLSAFDGLAVDATTVIVKYTYLGDASLDGQVDITDLGLLATSWQTAGLWTDGDFDRTGFIDISDLGLLATNWQAGSGSPLAPDFAQALTLMGLPAAAVPEPAQVLLLVGLASISVHRRRRLV